ncbi:uncharacterized protein HaLaN_22357 [Haematococcus lacustris]|uniref:Uncharacterized protein n=1 Tax=Haematococcus lacustris TaxID=44745 RepID=A0A699ZQG8_HAELA|nr:uncharacterized protein HaLaN_22357 [Haematococcus lacustris]
MKSSLPPPWQYPVQDIAFDFGTALVTMFYGPGLLYQIKELLRDETVDNTEIASRLDVLGEKLHQLSEEALEDMFDVNDEEKMNDYVAAWHERVALALGLGCCWCRGALATALFNSEYLGVITQVMDGLFDSMEYLQGSVDNQKLLSRLFHCTSDLCDAELPPDPAKGGKGPGAKELCAEALLEPLLTYVPQTKGLNVGVRRSGASALLSLVSSSKANQTRLLQHDALCQGLFANFIPSCADYFTQLDLMEVLYRCLRGAKTPPPDKFLPQPQVRTLFHSALTKTKTVDLAKELRACLLELNNTVPNPSVQSFKALSIQFSAPEVVRAHEPWLDVGNRQLTINVIIIDQETSPDDPPSPEPLDFDFDNIREATVQDGEGADAQGVCIVTLQLDKLPSVLQQEHSRLE